MSNEAAEPPIESGRYEVVIRPDEGVDKDHAELLKSRLTQDGFHDHVVHVRPVGEDGDASE